MAQALFPKLTGAPYKSYIEIGVGTHTLIMEKNRLALFEAVQQYFDELYRGAVRLRLRWQYNTKHGSLMFCQI